MHISKTTTIRVLCLVASMSLLGAGSFILGIEHSRNNIRELTERVAAQGPTNSFSVCLTEMWEKSGELDPKWKGERYWLLVDSKQQPVSKGK